MNANDIIIKTVDNKFTLLAAPLISSKGALGFSLIKLNKKHLSFVIKAAKRNY